MSRRCIPYEMQGLSFREFMLFYKQLDLPICTLEEVLNSPGDICSRVNEVCRPLAFFKEFLQYGYYPFYLKNQMDADSWKRFEESFEMLEKRFVDLE